MVVTPSCPVLLLHLDDDFRKKLIVELDRNHFSVAYFDDDSAAQQALADRPFRVILLSLDVAQRRGLPLLDYVRGHRNDLGAALIVIGEPHPELRTHALIADETLIKPVDPAYVVDRARTYCG